MRTRDVQSGVSDVLENPFFKIFFSPFDIHLQDLGKQHRRTRTAHHRGHPKQIYDTWVYPHQPHLDYFCHARR